MLTEDSTADGVKHDGVSRSLELEMMTGEIMVEFELLYLFVNGMVIDVNGTWLVRYWG